MSSTIAEAYVQLVPSFAGVKSQINSEMSELGSSSSKSFTKNFALGGAIAGAVSSVTTQVISSISDLAGQAITASDATDKFKKTLDFAGLDPKAIELLSKSTQSYADKTIYNLSDIQGITAQLASNGVKDYDKLAEAAGNLNSVSGGNADTFRSVGMVLTQTAGAGKLTTENWNQLANAIPGASGKLQEALSKNGAFTGNFRDAMAQGQITSEEFNTALMQLGTDPVAVEAARSTDTFEGALGNLQATIVGGLAEAFTAIKPYVADFTSAISTAVGWVKDNSSWLLPFAAGLGIAAAAIGIISIATAIWNAVLAVNPITWIILAIGLLIGAIILLAVNWDKVIKWIGDVWNGFVGWLSPGIKSIGDTFSSIFGAIGGIIRGAFEGVVGFVKGFVNNIIKFINTIIDGINGVAALGKAIGINVKLTHIPMLAKGGVVSSPTIAMVGERGPEAVIPLKQYESLIRGGESGGSGRIPKTVNYYAAPNQSLDAEQALFTAMRRAQILGGW